MAYTAAPAFMHPAAQPIQSAEPGLMSPSEKLPSLRPVSLCFTGGRLNSTAFGVWSWNDLSRRTEQRLRTLSRNSIHLARDIVVQNLLQTHTHTHTHTHTRMMMKWNLSKKETSWHEILSRPEYSYSRLSGPSLGRGERDCCPGPRTSGTPSSSTLRHIKHFVHGDKYLWVTNVTKIPDQRKEVFNKPIAWCQ
jgi:hypothetical protein